MKRIVITTMSGLAFSTGACSPTDEPVKTEEPTPVPDPEPNGNRDDGSAGTNRKKQLKTGLKV